MKQISICASILLTLLCGVSLFAVEDWALTETPVEDPIGLGERLALIDYFQENKVKLVPGMSLGELRIEYWSAHAQEQKRLDLYRKLRDNYNLPQLSKKMSYQALLSQEKEALRRKAVKREQQDQRPMSKRLEKKRELQKIKDATIGKEATVGKETHGSSTSKKTRKQKDSAGWPPVLGKIMPNVTLTNLQGKKVQLHSVSRGKPVFLEYVGMTCAGCNALLGGNDSSIGPFPGQPVQPGLESLARHFPKYAQGLKLGDRRFTYVIVLFYGLSGRTATNLKDAQAYAKHFKLSGQRNHVVLFGDASFIGPVTFGMIPGFQVTDKSWKLLSDSTGHHPKNNLWTHTIPELAKQVR